MYQPVRGTKDVVGDEKRHMNIILEKARALADAYFYREIETPIFESTDVFYRLGATSDVITKETYTFQDRGGDSITLRPEGTAPVVRALISNGLTQEMPGKYFYTGPMFRYDRPQKGRFRQFTQLGIELFGVDHPLGDVEVIALGYDILKSLDLQDKVTLEINTLGDQESRNAYREALISYFTPHAQKLSQDSQRRLQENPMRILDSKDPQDHTIIADAPSYQDYLTAPSKEFFEKVCAGLKNLNIPFVINPRLVRGLDYYCHTAFEFITSELGAQGTVLAGGRYDGLVQQMGGPEVSGVGFAAGIERLMLLHTFKDQRSKPVAVVPMGDEALDMASSLTHMMRTNGMCAEIILTGNLGKRMKKADRMEASHCLIIGDAELASGQFVLKNLATGHEIRVSKEQLLERLKS